MKADLVALESLMPDPNTIDGAKFWNTLAHKDKIIKDLPQGSSHALVTLSSEMTSFFVDRDNESPSSVKHKILRKPYGRAKVVHKARIASEILTPFFEQNEPELLAADDEIEFYRDLRNIYNEIQQFLAAEANKGPESTR